MNPNLFILENPSSYLVDVTDWSLFFHKILCIISIICFISVKLAVIHSSFSYSAWLYLFFKIWAASFLILEKLTEYGDEIKRLEETLQQTRNSNEERERQLKRDLEMKVWIMICRHSIFNMLLFLFVSTKMACPNNNLIDLCNRAIITLAKCRKFWKHQIKSAWIREKRNCWLPAFCFFLMVFSKGMLVWCMKSQTI